MLFMNGRSHRTQLWLLIPIMLGCAMAACDGESTRERSDASPGANAGRTVADAEPARSSDMPGSDKAQKDTLPRIVAFGDSLTAGFGVAPQDAYPAQLQRRLDALGYRYHVVNAGVSGETTAGGVRRVSWILNGNPHIVILELGGNDGLRGLDIEQSRANLEAIIVRLKQAGIITVLAGMKLPPNYGADYTARFEIMYRDLARRHGLPLIPFLLDGVGGDRRLNQPDGIHPTGEGYRIVVENVLRTLEPLLDRPTTGGKGEGHTKADQRPSGL
ncbi:MAG: arylesterase [Nitrospiraceae bacterium]